MALAERDTARALRWEDQFLPWFSTRWRPGDHVALVGPTGTGKSTLAVGILPTRKYVLALDPKGGDSTLSRLSRHGFERLPRWPPTPKHRKKLERGEPVRLIVGPVVRKREDMPKLRGVMAQALDGAFDEGGWTVYVDELQVAADRRMMNLSPSIERNLIAARDKGVSMVTSFQRPANVPRAAGEMSTWMFVWYTRDVDTVDRLAQMAGRPKAEIRGAVRGLANVPHGVLVFSRDPRQPIIITRPNKA